jgi:hypothetical protein
MAAALVPCSPCAAVTADLGLKGGLSVADITGDETDFITRRTALMGGGFVQIGVTRLFAVRIEALYAMKGGDFAVDFFSAPFEGTLEFEYVEVPVLAVGMFPASDAVTLSIFGGPVIDFNTHAAITGEIDGDDQSRDISDDVASTDFGVAIGVGGSVAVGSIGIVMDVRYTIGLADAIDVGSGDQRNVALGVMAGVSFLLNR